MLGIAKNGARHTEQASSGGEVSDLREMDAFGDTGKVLQSGGGRQPDKGIAHTKRGKQGTESVDEMQAVPKVKVRHPRVIQSEETQPDEVEDTSFIFNGKNLFGIPTDDAEDGELESEPINFFESEESEEKELPEPAMLAGNDGKKETENSSELQSFEFAEDDVPAVSEEPADFAQDNYVGDEAGAGKEFLGDEPVTQQQAGSREESKPEQQKHRTDVITHLANSVSKFKKLNSGLASEEVEIRYQEDGLTQVEVLKDGAIIVQSD